MSMIYRTRRAGFTLIETLIAIGALLLIALGIAKIFDSTGKTVTVGRRVSTMTEYAAILESRFRADFGSMTRDGFLIIRNEYANLGVEVPLHADERASDSRRRRVDEIMFFTKGPVSSVREAFTTGYPAESNQASVYYGHAQQRRENFARNSFYRRPNVADFNFDWQAQLGFQTAGSPNRYASSWNLLRHVTVLAQPSSSVTKIFGNGNGMTPLPAGIGNADWVIDGEYQIGLRPAVASPFRALASIPPSTTKPPVSLGLYVGGEGTPQMASGVVDIATTDLAEIRQIITTVDSVPSDVNSFAELNAILQRGEVSELGFMHQWMDDALPAYSMAPDSDSRSRMRAEPSAPDYMGVLEEMQGTPTSRKSMLNAIDRANQLAVASSVFVPSCTEFIVEWSFGKVDTNGQIIWHGKERRVDFDGDGRLEIEELVALPYQSSLLDFMTIPLRIRTDRGTVLEDPNSTTSPANPSGIDEWPVAPALIHGSFVKPIFSAPLTSYFGYFDPTFSPDRRDSVGLPNQNGRDDDPGDALSPTIPWAWPELIRITMTLADPIDPTIEQSFQFVLDAPGNPVY